MKNNDKNIPLVTPGTIILLFLILLGAVMAVYRFAKGLGASTNLSDTFPWGLWIGVDVLSGVALAAGGFTIAAAVYIFNLKKYHPILRPAILTAFLGYMVVIVALLFDLGKPYNIWHPMVMWQPHSVMFEVGWCVMLYSTVLALEFSPAALEKFKMDGLLKIIKVVTIPLVIAGIILSTLHQSSLGSLFLIVPDKLHSIWYTPLLPVMFFVSAVMVGLAMVI
ncbi:MAG: NrfD/PsrC family molybdoenzyme membrane anchor subunit, partial [Planctomycetota bacterium]